MSDEFDPTAPEDPHLGEEPVTPIKELKDAPPDESDENPDPEDPDWEQALRDRMGYSPTEKRTKAERDAAAQAEPSPEAMLAAVGEIELPDDIKAIWGHSPEDIKTAQTLIDAWGLEAFRGSQLHLAALQEARSAKDRAANQKAFLDAQKRLKR